MREIAIDLSALEDHYDGGFCGESNASVLFVDIRSLEQSDAAYYLLRFQTQLGEILLSERFYPQDIQAHLLELPLWQALTQDERLTFCAEVYTLEDGQVHMLKKSPPVTLTFAKNVHGDGQTLTAGTKSILNQLDALVARCENLYGEIQRMHDGFIHGIPLYSCDEYKLAVDYQCPSDTNSISLTDLQISGRFFAVVHVEGAESNGGSTALRIMVNGGENAFWEAQMVVGSLTANTFVLSGACSPFVNMCIYKDGAFGQWIMDTDAAVLHSLTLKTYNQSRYMSPQTYVRFYTIQPQADD